MLFRSLDKQSFTRVAAELVRQVTGVPAKVSVKEGAALAEDAPAGGDALDAFLAQGGSNIIVE